MQIPIWTDEDFTQAVREARCFSDVERFLGYAKLGGAGRASFIKKHAEKLGLRLDHFLSSPGIMQARTRENIFCENSSAAPATVRRWAKKHEDIKYECSHCDAIEVVDNGAVYRGNGKAIVLQLDHRNGDRTDNRIENLRWLCPNCHSQTPTFAGKKNVELKKQEILERLTPMRENIRECEWCKSSFKHQIRKTRYCSASCSVIARRKVIHPTKSLLSKLVWEMPTEKVAEKYGVTGKAVEKWCKKYKIDKPGRGYWAKKAKAQK